MSWVRVWIHLVFTTKNREHLLLPEIRNEIFTHIMDNAKKKEIWLDCINGYSDHVHCLLLLSKDQTISDIVQLIKGESSFWINKNKLHNKFQWQDDYWAVGISESHIQSVRKYFHNQEEHHRVKTFAEEIDSLMKKYNWTYKKS